MAEKFENIKKSADVDMVNRPPHYNRDGAMECIEEMELIFGKEAVKHFCLCNAWKYRYRAADKNGEEDIKKSDWYLRKYKELCADEISSLTIPKGTPAPTITPYQSIPTYDTPYITCNNDCRQF